MRIVILGTRGFPNVQGGVEKHCQELTTNLVKLGHEVIVFTRASYVDPTIKEYHGVKLVSLPVLRIKGLEAGLHTFIGIFAALKYKPNILHIQAIGPGLFIPLARILGMKVVLTTHGSNYRHKKWGRCARVMLRIAEYIGIKSANSVIAVSNNIAIEIQNKYGREINFIPNGVNVPLLTTTETILNKYKLEKGKYILSVGRFVPEKGFELLIKAFAEVQKQKLKNYKLVIAGDADHEDSYSLNLKKMAQETDNVILTGFLTGQPLEELYTHATLFVLPSYYEGLPIVLMEAISYGLPCISSDIVSNREVGVEEDHYFKPGDINGIAKMIKEFSYRPIVVDQKQKQIREILERYDWQKVAVNTVKIYSSVCNRSSKKNFDKK